MKHISILVKAYFDKITSSNVLSYQYILLVLLISFTSLAQAYYILHLNTNNGIEFHMKPHTQTQVRMIMPKARTQYHCMLTGATIEKVYKAVPINQPIVYTLNGSRQILTFTTPGHKEISLQQLVIELTTSHNQTTYPVLLICTEKGKEFAQGQTKDLKHGISADDVEAITILDHSKAVANKEYEEIESLLERIGILLARSKLKPFTKSALKNMQAQLEAQVEDKKAAREPKADKRKRRFSIFKMFDKKNKLHEEIDANIEEINKAITNISGEDIDYERIDQLMMSLDEKTSAEVTLEQQRKISEIKIAYQLMVAARARLIHASNELLDLTHLLLKYKHKELPEAQQSSFNFEEVLSRIDDCQRLVGTEPQDLCQWIKYLNFEFKYIRPTT